MSNGDEHGGTGPLDAGAFGPWLRRTVAMLGRSPGAGDGSDVPCDGCTACCESSQFVLVEPDELDARAAIPAELLFPAPGAPTGFSLLPYDEHGRCPMLRDGACSIYAHRPRTCRAYDCRVLAAAAFLAGHGEELPGGAPPPTQRAALAVEVHDLFLDDGSPGPTEVLVELRRRLSPR